MIVNEEWDRMFLHRVNFIDSGCWEWSAKARVNGYGYVWYKDRCVKAHRLSWVLANGPLPKRNDYHGTCVCHSCDNRLCINPAHLWIGSNGENLRDMKLKGRAASGVHSSGHKYPKRGEANGSAKLTEHQVCEIRRLARTVPRAVIAKMFSISVTQTAGIITKKSWRHI